MTELYFAHSEQDLVFVPTKLDKSRKRFGFVRLSDQNHFPSLEEKLKNFWIESYKLFINKPRFEKGQKVPGSNYGNQDHRPGALKASQTAPMVDRSHLQGDRRKPLPRAPRVDRSHLQGDWRKPLSSMDANEDAFGAKANSHPKTIVLECQEAELEKAKEGFVGKLINLSDVIGFQDILIKEGFYSIKCSPMGGNWVLLQGLDSLEIPELIEKEKDWIIAWFSDIFRWHPSFMEDRIGGAFILAEEITAEEGVCASRDDENLSTKESDEEWGVQAEGTEVRQTWDDEDDVDRVFESYVIGAATTPVTLDVSQLEIIQKTNLLLKEDERYLEGSAEHVLENKDMSISTSGPSKLIAQNRKKEKRSSLDVKCAGDDLVLLEPVRVSAEREGEGIAAGQLVGDKVNKCEVGPKPNNQDMTELSKDDSFKEPTKVKKASCLFYVKKGERESKNVKLPRPSTRRTTGSHGRVKPKPKEPVTRLATMPRTQDESISNSIENSHIKSCSRLHSRAEESVPRRLWSTAKHLGITFDGEDQEMERMIKEMETRDVANNITRVANTCWIRCSDRFAMICVSFNSRGLGSRIKRKDVVDLVRKNNVDFLAIQESKIEEVDSRCCASLWNDADFDWDFVPSSCRSGGIISIWRSSKFIKSNSI
ncbi:hypothetical protein RIF29_13987 [Crotalaria pallida]|uniref:Endonuclease/exonuclease/phosphatase n=1 Tax=Crotalaria pallida TaxID=3830 RepID=A0AAN9FAK4_CROPI